METCFCLGSNEGDRLRWLCRAKSNLLLDSKVRFLDQSYIYETEPVAVREEHRAKKFLNAVLIVESPYAAEEWLPRIRQIETALFRVRTEDRNAPRTIDIDILYCGDQVIDSDQLQIPHPHWSERRFVVEPLAEVRAEMVLPGTDAPVRKVLARMPDNDEVRLFTERW